MAVLVGSRCEARRARCATQTRRGRKRERAREDRRDRRLVGRHASEGGPPQHEEDSKRHAGQTIGRACLSRVMPCPYIDVYGRASYEEEEEEETETLSK